MTNYAKQQMLRRETQARFPYLIEIHHFTESGAENIYRYANTDEDVTYNNATYTASCFSITPSEKTSSGFSDAKLTISAIDQEWIVKIRETQKRAKIIFTASITVHFPTQ